LNIKGKSEIERPVIIDLDISEMPNKLRASKAISLKKAGIQGIQSR